MKKYKIFISGVQKELKAEPTDLSLASDEN